MNLVIHVDGGARGNPGPAGAGVVIAREDGAPLFEAAYYLGKQTNNAAEYHALVRAVQRAAEAQPESVVIHSDSELLVRQITGAYQVKSPKLAQLFDQAQLGLLKLGRWTIRHVRREQNRRADELANLAMDRRENIVVLDAANDDGTLTNTSTPPNHATENRDDEPVVVPPASGERRVRIQCSRQPKAGACPAEMSLRTPIEVGTTLPAELCVHAAHALLPSLLAVLNTDAEEFAAVPTLTVRCGHTGCQAEFQLSPVLPSNGEGEREID